jgi:hypothetical protein
MKITKTNIPDFKETVEKSKIDLANKVLYVLIPLMNSDYQKKLKEIKSLNELLVNKKKKVNLEKADLEILMKDYNVKKKVKTLLERIMKLLGSGLLIGEFKKEMLVVLNVVEELPEDKLNFYLGETVRVFNKKLKNNQ